MVALFLIDAMRFDYINEQDAPFLSSCLKNGELYKRVIPSSGFCERNEIFTGETPRESGFFTAIGYDPESSPYKGDLWVRFMGKIELLAEKLPLQIKGYKLSQIVRKVFLRIFRRTFNEKKLKPYNIPFSLLKNFRLTEDFYSHFDGPHLKEHSIFELLNKSGKKFDCSAFTSLNMKSNGDDMDRLDLAMKVVKKQEVDFIPIYLSLLDTIGHKYGPNSLEIRNAISHLDEQLKTFVQELTRVEPDCQFVFLGDHGMSEVFESFDIMGYIKTLMKKNGLKINKDYTLFADSTILRIWGKSQKLDTINSLLKSDDLINSKGSFITDSDREKYFLPNEGRLYGDFAWWANEGVLIFPDYFHTAIPYKGMHGYKTDAKSTYGTCIVWGNNVSKMQRDEIYLHEVYDILTTHLL